MYQKLNIDRMTSAYRLLYEIEIKLRQIITENHRIRYGPHRKLPINFSRATFFDLVNHLHDYPAPHTLLSPTQFQQLHELKNVRNKICHMRDLTSEEGVRPRYV